MGIDLRTLVLYPSPAKSPGSSHGKALPAVRAPVAIDSRNCLTRKTRTHPKHYAHRAGQALAAACAQLLIPGRCRMKIACVLVTHLRAKVEMRRQPHLRDQPAVIVDRSQGRPMVIDHFPAAVGVAAGMTLEQALSRQSGGVVLDAERGRLPAGLPTGFSSPCRESATGWRSQSLARPTWGLTGWMPCTAARPAF